MSAIGRLLGVRAPAQPGRPAGNDTPPKGASGSIWYSTPGMPQVPLWDGLTAIQNGYLASLYIMQPVRIIATALGSLPFRVGADPNKPSAYDSNASMARLLGPPPHGPNPVTSPRNLWIWSIVQRLICGRMAWETVCPAGSNTPAALWPLVAPFVQPIPAAAGTARWFDGYQYQLPAGNVTYKPDDVFYSWRPSQMDWRQPESALQAANLPASLQIALDRYMWALAKDGLAAKKLVITPEFADDDERRAWEEQFASEFTGYDNGGRVMHGYYEDDPNASTQGQQRPPIQVVDLATTPADAQVIQILESARADMLRTWRVPLSWLGDSSQRTYENASQEAKNFWQGPVREAAAEIADDVNMYLAPRFADGNVGWWDFSGVEALKGASIFAPIAPDAAVKAGLIDPDDWRNDVGLTPLNPKDTDLSDEALPAIDDTPGGTSKANFTRAAATLVAAGLCVKALDTGRVLLLQRSMDDSDPAAGMWEFPGGKLEPGEDPFAAAVREWQEEVGCSLPQGRVAGTWTSQDGVYRGFVYLIASESLVPVNLDHEDRHLLNPDDPDGDQIEVVAWWNPAQLPAMSGLRPEARKGTDWHLIATAGAERATLTSGHRAGECTGDGPCDVSPFSASTTDNWVARAGGLPPYIRAIAHAMGRNGEDESAAIQRAVGIIRNWAEGKGKVTAATRGRAAKALAEWEALKAKAQATPNRRDAVMESGSSGLLVPKANASLAAIQRHVYRAAASDRKKCVDCGQPVIAPPHQVVSRPRRKRIRHAGAGHAKVTTGHHSARRRKVLAQVHGQADNLEPAITTAMRGLFAAQRKATLDRLNGRRGQQLLRAAQQPPEPPVAAAGTQAPAAQPAPLVDAAQIYDLAHWIAKTEETLTPAFAAVKSMTADRFATQLGAHQTSSSLAGVQAALDARLQRLAQTVSATTFDQVAQVLRDGVAQGQTVAQMTTALEQVFTDAEANRAPTIARTESLGALNEGAAVYAQNVGPDVVAGKEWLSAHDDRVRPTHRVADGQVRSIAMPFDVGGSPMMFPHDPVAPPDETVNCRCSTAYLTRAEYAQRTQPADVAA